MNALEVDPHVLQALSLSFNDEKHLSKLLATLSVPPLYTTLRYDRSQVDDGTALEVLSSYLAKQCEETGRQKFTLFQHPVLRDCIVIENRGPHNIVEMEKEIIVDISCGMAVLRGAHVYKQGIMGATYDLKAGDAVSVYADLDGKCLKGFAAKYEGKKLHVGNGMSMVSRADLYNTNTASNCGLGILMSQPVYEAPSLSDLPLSWIYPQNLPSIVCVHTLKPQPGETVLDMCAAPGGKTSHIAALMRDEGRLVALEKSRGRAQNMEKIKSKCMEIYVFDSTKAVSDSADAGGGPPYPMASFDRILVDAPCSALGQRPCHVNKISINQLKSFPVIQHKLLLTAAQLLKPGGVLVYSTCTVTREENEDQVSRLLAKDPNMELVFPPFKAGGDGLPGCDLTEEQRSKVQRFDPCISASDQIRCELYNIDTIGFFIAKFQKKKENIHVSL